MSETKNAKISSTFLGYESHGILTCYLRLDYGGISQSFGGYYLSHYGLEMIQEILKVTEVESWENLKGNYVKVYIDSSGVIRRIGHVIKDIWYSPENL